MSDTPDRHTRLARFWPFAAVMVAIGFCEALTMVILLACDLHGAWTVVLDPLLLLLLVGPFLLWVLLGKGGNRPAHQGPPETTESRAGAWKTVASMAIAGGVAAAVVVGLIASQRRFEGELVRSFQQHQLETARSIAVSVEEAVGQTRDSLHHLAAHPSIVEGTDGVQFELDLLLKESGDLLNNLAIADANGDLTHQSPRTDEKRNIPRNSRPSGGPESPVLANRGCAIDTDTDAPSA